jgi:hypothetical protein
MGQVCSKGLAWVEKQLAGDNNEAEMTPASFWLAGLYT